MVFFGAVFLDLFLVLFLVPLERAAAADLREAADRRPVLRFDFCFREPALRLAMSNPLSVFSAAPRRELGSEATLTVYL